MVKAILICTALAALSLTGCAGPSADVHTSHAEDAAAALQGERTYTLARMPSQDASADHPRFEQLLRDELAKQGFTDAGGNSATSARYLLSIAYDTRLAAVGVDTKNCGAGRCASPPDAPFSLFGGPAYRHELTLRFFARASGQEVYKVSAVSADRDADPLRAMPALVKSALAKLPFAMPADWRVKLRTDASSGATDVISVKPLQP
nr:hypothetical protein HUO10_005665 [Paraburkholderia busanensis]